MLRVVNSWAAKSKRASLLSFGIYALLFPLRPLPLRVSPSRQALRGFQNLFRPRAHPVIFRQHAPANRSSRIDEKLSRPRDVATIFTLTLVDQIVARNGVEPGVRKKGKGVAGFLAEFARLFRTINADGDGTNAGLVKLGEIFLNAPQLGVAGWSPVAPVENQQDAFRGLAVDWLRTQLSQRHRFIVRINEGKVRRLLSHLRCTGRYRQPT